MIGFDLLGYIDPGTGAMMLQILAAGILTAGVVFRRIFVWPLALLRRAFGGKSPREIESEPPRDTV